MSRFSDAAARNEAYMAGLRDEIRTAARDHTCEEILNWAVSPMTLCGRKATHVAFSSEWDWKRQSTWRCRRCWYRGYLKSSHWESLREQRLRRSSWTCERCGQGAGMSAKGNRTGLNLHHLSYERVGLERDEDIIVLCSECHAKEHGINA